MTTRTATIAQTLVNVRDTTSVFEHRSREIDHFIVDAGETVHNLADASTTLKVTVANLQRTSDKADRLIDTADVTFDHATKLVVDLDSTVQAIRPGLRDLTTNGTAQLDELLSEARRLVASLNRVSTGPQRDPSWLLLGDRREGKASDLNASRRRVLVAMFCSAPLAGCSVLPNPPARPDLPSQTAG